VIQSDDYDWPSIFSQSKLIDGRTINVIQVSLIHFNFQFIFWGVSQRTNGGTRGKKRPQAEIIIFSNSNLCPKLDFFI
jgi:hypothetical protein